MGLGEKFGQFFGKNHEPDLVVKGPGGIDVLMYNIDNTYNSMNAFRNASDFIAREFTKVIFSLSNVPNEKSIEYMLSLKPNDNQTSNEFLYEFAKGVLVGGRVYYRVKRNDKVVTSIEFSRYLKNGFQEFEANYLKMRVPSELLDQYEDTLNRMSSVAPVNSIELETKVNARDDPQEVINEMDNRLQRMRAQLQKYGAFTTVTGEKATDHPNTVKPDKAVLEDLKQLIYEQLNVNPKVLTGDYSEADYRAFYATHIQPISAALEDFLNQVVLTKEAWQNGSRIEVILDLLQFATLSDYTNYADKMVRGGMLMPDEGRHRLGLKNLPDNLGKIVYSNKNAVAINNPDINALLMTGGSNGEQEGEN